MNLIGVLCFRWASRRSLLDAPFFPLLTRSLHLSGRALISQTFSDRSNFSSGDISIEMCQFHGIQSQVLGGAVFSASPLGVWNSNFVSSHGSRGGAIYSHASLSLTRSTFSHCTAEKAGAVHLDSDSNLTIARSILSDSHAKLFGTIYCHTPSSFALTSTNVTGSRAGSCVGALEAKQARLRLFASAFVASTAKLHHGCVYVREATSFSAERCLFWRCSHTSDDSAAGAALVCNENPFESGVTGCVFDKCVSGGSFTISVHAGHCLWVCDCWFSGEEAKEINAANVAAEGCKFGGSGAAPSIAMERSIGYDAALRTKEVETKTKAVDLQGFGWLALAVTGVCVTIVAMAARTIGGLKRPRAVQ
jgi:hypothetical protein